mgnify:CR=1 FL=1
MSAREKNYAAPCSLVMHSKSRSCQLAATRCVPRFAREKIAVVHYCRTHVPLRGLQELEVVFERTWEGRGRASFHAAVFGRFVHLEEF